MVAAAETSTLTPKHILSIIIANLMLESMLYNILFCKNVKNLKQKMLLIWKLAKKPYHNK